MSSACMVITIFHTAGLIIFNIMKSNEFRIKPFVTQVLIVQNADICGIVFYYVNRTS